MKQIRLKCLRDGNVQLYENTLIFNAENQATEFVVDYSGTTAEGLFKHVEILVGTDKTTRIFSLGQDDIVSFVIKQDITKAGYIYIQPYATLTVSEEDFTKIYFHKSQISVRSSINALHTDTSFTPSIAEQFQIDLDLLSLGLSELQTQVNELSASDIQYGDGTVEDALLGITQNLVDLEDEKMDTDGLNSLVKKLRFDTADAQALVNIGDIHWSQDNRTLELKVSNDVTLSLGQEQLIRGRNNQGSPMSNGKVFYISGTTGVNAQFRLATNADPEIARRTIGVLTEDFGTNDDGYGCTNGIVNDINTSMFTGGDLVYLGTNGNLTNIEPTGDAIVVCIGVVLRSHVNQGRIYVSPKCIPTLDRLSRVTITSKVDNQVLVSQGEQWVNVNLDKNAVGLSNVDNTSDVNKPISTATQTALDGKANTVHTHTKSQITDFAHTHPISEVVNLQTELNGKVDKLMATNLVTNGDFSNGTTGWNAFNVTQSANSNQLTATATSSNSEHYTQQSYASPIANNIYYAFTELKSTNAKYQLVIFNRISSGSFEAFQSNVLSSSGRVSVRLSLTTVNQSPSLLFRHQIRNLADTGIFAGNGEFIVVSSCGLINLTALFGPGNEPTKEQMDALLSVYPNSWFNGTSEIGSIGALMRATLGEQIVTPTLLNSRTGTAQYIITKEGFVHFMGTASGGSLNTNIFVLPDNIRPTATRTFPISANNAFGVVTVATNGEVRQTVGALTNVFLDGIAFKVGV